MIIRQENSKDFDNIYHLVKEAFESAEHKDGNEQDLVNELRNGSSYIPELSLVAEENGKLAGHIMFTKAFVGNKLVLVLAPLSVAPNFQNRGVGTALVQQGHKIAKEKGFEFSFVLGSDKYYSRFGYVPSVTLGVDAPKGVPTENFMVLKLKNNDEKLCKNIVFAKEFGM